ncbi:MAG: hypothetical protein ACUVS6_03190 [Anaerolineae bacterium]
MRQRLIGRRLRSAALVLAGLFLAWFIAKEAIEPHWSIRLMALPRPGPPPYELTLADGLAVRAYPDTRPHVGKIASLQKGLVLAQDGHELIEEGYGFGVPIVIYQGRSYVSRHATVVARPTERRIVKEFEVDVEDTWTELFRRKYRPVSPLGSIVFTYTVAAAGTLEVAVDFSRLLVPAELVYLPHEQGARHFTLYSDSDGVVRDFADFADQWVPTRAAVTCFTAKTRRLRFCTETASGQAKYMGRERYNQYRWSGIFWLSWAGTDIELARPTGVYRYRVTVERVDDVAPVGRQDQE